MSMEDLWNSTLTAMWPFSDILPALKIDCLPSGISLFILDAPNKILPHYHVNWQYVVSVATTFNQLKHLPIPTKPTEFPQFIVEIVKVVEKDKTNSFESYSQDIYKLSSDPRKRIPFPGVIGFLDQLFTHKFHFEGSDEDFYDIDLHSHIPENTPRLYKSKLINIASNNLLNFRRYFFERTPITQEQADKLVELLESTRKGTKYVNLDKMGRILQKTTEKLKYVDHSFRIASDNETLFNFVKALAERFRTPTRITSPTKADAPSSSSGTGTGSAGGKRKVIPKTVRDKVWREAFGSLDGECYCCRAPIQIENWEAGHIVADAKGGLPTMDNLRPICRGCNRSMGTRNMDEFITEYNLPGPPKKKEKMKAKGKGKKKHHSNKSKLSK